MARNLHLGLVLWWLLAPIGAGNAQEPMVKQVQLGELSRFPKQFQKAIKATSEALAKRDRNPSDYFVTISKGGTHFTGPSVITIYCQHRDHLTPEMQKWIRSHISLGDPCGKCIEIEYSTKHSKVLSIYQIE